MIIFSGNRDPIFSIDLFRQNVASFRRSRGTAGRDRAASSDTRSDTDEATAATPSTGEIGSPAKE